MTAVKNAVHKITGCSRNQKGRMYKLHCTALRIPSPPGFTVTSNQPEWSVEKGKLKVAHDGHKLIVLLF